MLIHSQEVLVLCFQVSSCPQCVHQAIVASQLLNLKLLSLLIDTIDTSGGFRAVPRVPWNRPMDPTGQLLQVTKQNLQVTK